VFKKKQQTTNPKPTNQTKKKKSKLEKKKPSTTSHISFLEKYCGQAISVSDTRQELFRHVTKQLCNLVFQDLTDLSKN